MSATSAKLESRGYQAEVEVKPPGRKGAPHLVSFFVPAAQFTGQFSHRDNERCAVMQTGTTRWVQGVSDLIDRHNNLKKAGVEADATKKALSALSMVKIG